MGFALTFAPHPRRPGDDLFDVIETAPGGLRMRAARALRASAIVMSPQSPPPASTGPQADDNMPRPVRHHVMSRSEAEHAAVDLYRRMQLPNPEEIGFRYPHQSRSGQLQRAMTAMAMSCRPDLNHTSTSPHTALDVTRRSRFWPRTGISWNSSTRPPRLHHPRLGRGATDGRPHQGVAPGRRRVETPTRASCWTHRRGLHQVPVGRRSFTRSHAAALRKGRDRPCLGPPTPQADPTG